MTATRASPGASSGVGTCSTCSERRGSLSRVASPANISTSSLCTVAARYVSAGPRSRRRSRSLRSPERMASRIWSMRSCSFGGEGVLDRRWRHLPGEPSRPTRLRSRPYDGPHGVIRLTGAGDGRRPPAYSAVVSLASALPPPGWCSVGSAAGHLRGAGVVEPGVPHPAGRGAAVQRDGRVPRHAGWRELVPAGRSDAVVPGTRVLAGRPLTARCSSRTSRRGSRACAPWVSDGPRRR